MGQKPKRGKLDAVNGVPIKKIKKFLNRKVTVLIAGLTKMEDYCDHPERSGAWVTITDLLENKEAHFKFGFFYCKETRKAYRRNSREKGERTEPLFRSNKHTNSGWSADPENSKYAGLVIIGGRWMISTSGYHPDADALVGLLIGKFTKLLISATGKKARKLVYYSKRPNNMYIGRLRRKKRAIRMQLRKERA